MHQEIVTLLANIESRHPQWMARPAARPFRTVQVVAKNLAPRLVLPKNTKSSTEATRQRARVSRRQRAASNLNRNNFTTMFYSQPTPACDRMKAWRLRFRDVTIVDDEGSGHKILEIQEVRTGKRGVGYCKSMPGAVVPFERLKARLRPARANYATNEDNGSNTTVNTSGELPLPAGTDRPHLPNEWQRTRAIQNHPRRGKSQI